MKHTTSTTLYARLSTYKQFAVNASSKFNSPIVKVLLTPAAIGATTIQVIDAVGHILTGNAASYHNTAGIQQELESLENLLEAASVMRSRHYRNVEISEV